MPAIVIEMSVAFFGGRLLRPCPQKALSISSRDVSPFFCFLQMPLFLVDLAFLQIKQNSLSLALRLDAATVLLNDPKTIAITKERSL